MLALWFQALVRIVATWTMTAFPKLTESAAVTLVLLFPDQGVISVTPMAIALWPVTMSAAVIPVFRYPARGQVSAVQTTIVSQSVKKSSVTA